MLFSKVASFDGELPFSVSFGAYQIRVLSLPPWRLLVDLHRAFLRGWLKMIWTVIVLIVTEAFASFSYLCNVAKSLPSP
jgi:hypothetical protein